MTDAFFLNAWNCCSNNAFTCVLIIKCCKQDAESMKSWVFSMIVLQTLPSSGYTAPFIEIRWHQNTYKDLYTKYGHRNTLLWHETSTTFLSFKRILLSRCPQQVASKYLLRKMFSLNCCPLHLYHRPEQLSWFPLHSSHTSTVLSGWTLASA